MDGLDRLTMRDRRLNFITITVWLISGAGMATLALLRYGQDFRGYYAAARVVLAGGNPYDYHVLAPVLLAVTGKMGNNPYYYLPWFAWLMIPFAILPFNIARGVWMFFNLAVWNFSLLRLSKLLHSPEPGWRRWLLYSLATLIFAWMTWRYEQTGILLFAMLVEALLALRNNHQFRTGLWLALALIKPNVTLLPVAAICLWLLRRRVRRPVAIMGAIVLALVVISLVITPNWFAPFFEPGFSQGLDHELNGPDQIVATRINTTLSAWLAAFHLPDAANRTISVLAFSAGLIFLAIAMWKSNSLIQIMAVSLLVDFAITPYALQYDYPLLVPVFFWTISLIGYIKNRWSRLAGVAMVVFIASVLFWERPISDGYWMVLGLIGLAAWERYTVDEAQISPDPILA